ncbi:hypothetical protein U9M48_035861 [Paspalum notatum var. saurae]|uniref:Uncharacterized protein n=1 Tax=Paspalum notatum var. saurae TaxID=547442 RepID=A0AAQ3X9F8_PASNO
MDRLVGWSVVNIDKDITPLDTNNNPPLNVQGPITRARARQLNPEVSSFLNSSSYDYENRLLPNDYIVIRNHGEGQGILGEGLGGMEDQQGHTSQEGGPNQLTSGDEQTNSPKDFDECVSRAQLQAAMEESQRGMNDAIKKAVTDALIDIKLGSSIERLDRRISTLTDKVTELENRLPNKEDMGGNNTDEDAVFDEDGNIDAAATQTAIL